MWGKSVILIEQKRSSQNDSCSKILNCQPTLCMTERETRTAWKFKGNILLRKQSSKMYFVEIDIFNLRHFMSAAYVVKSSYTSTHISQILCKMWCKLASECKNARCGVIVIVVWTGYYSKLTPFTLHVFGKWNLWRISSGSARENYADEMFWRRQS